MRIKKEKKHKKKKLKIIIILLVVIIVIYAIVLNFLVNATQVPSFMSKLDIFVDISERGYAERIDTDDIVANRNETFRKRDAWLETVESQTLNIESEDGYNLVAQEFLRDDDSHNWVLIMHGYTGKKESMYRYAYWYHQEGYHVICPDLRCQGESQGDFIGMGYTDAKDCMMWVDYIITQDSQANIVLHGQSMGAATALMMSGRDDLPDNIIAVISDCSFTDAYTMFKEKIKDWYNLPAFPIVDSASLILKIKAGYTLKDASALDAVSNSSIPTLFIHGEEDKMINVHMAHELYDAATCEKELLLIPGAGHGQASEKDPDKFFETISDFVNNVKERSL